MEYTLIRARRKTIALYVRDDGLEVRAPLNMPKKDIDSFVEQKRSWAESKLAESAARNGQKAAFEVNYGSRLPYRGSNWIVGGVPGRHVFFENAFCVPVHLNPEQIKRGCAQIYRLLARRDLTEKVNEYAAKMSVKPSGIKINGAKTRWGSCSAKKSLNFSWKLMMADDFVIDYVVVHELAHIKELNHSARFWAVVEGILPDYKKRQQQLKALQKRLSTENWD